MAGRQLLRGLAPLLGRSSLHITRGAQKLNHIQVKSIPRSVSHHQHVRCLSTKAKFDCINIQDEQDFQKRVMENSSPVVVDFHATWCGPCKLLGPRLESIIAGKEGKVVLAKIDIDENADLAVRFGVTSVPTVVSIKGGQPQGKFIGLQEDDIIDSFVERLLN